MGTTTAKVSPSTPAPSRQREQTLTGDTLPTQEAPPMRIIHDIPPAWGGTDPERELEAYLKQLTGWLTTTRTLKTQQGMTILNSAHGDLKLVINELEIEELTAEDSGQVVLKHVQKSYAEYMEKKLPQAIENAIYDKGLLRKQSESMLQYCLRRDKLFKKLAKEGWSIPETAKGYILLRDAHLPDKARDLIEMWTAGDYEYTAMQKYLKKLERPVPGTGGQRVTGLTAFVEEEASALATQREATSSTFVV